MKRLYLCVLLLFLCFFVGATEVDTLGVSRELHIDEVEIRSFKQDRSYKLMPVSVSSLGYRAIQNTVTTGMKELSVLVPNLFTPDYGSKQGSPVYIRGIGSRINSPSVGLYVDGVPYFEKSTFDFDFNAIESIDVLRGPQGTLYGRNTMGGVVNVYTKSPLSHKGSSAYFTGGAYTQLDAGAEHYGRAGDKLGYSASVNYSHLGGYFENAYTSEKADKSDSGSARVRFVYQASDKLSFDLISSVDLLDQGGYPYSLYDKETGFVNEVNYNDASYYRRSISTTGLSAKYNHEKFTLSAQTSYQYVKDNQGVDQDFTTVDKYYVIQRQRQNMVSEEINIKSTSTRNYKWMFGAFGFYQKINNGVNMDYKQQGMITDKRYGMPNGGAALYHQSVIDNLFAKGLTLTLGLRYDYEHASMDYVFDRYMGGAWSVAEDFVSKLNFSQISPKIALQYLITPDVNVYGTITRGFKAGGFNTSFDRKEDRSFSPEYSWNYEVGTKTSCWDGRINTELTLFYIDWRHQQIYQPLPSGKGSMLKNAGRSSSKGVELSTHIRPIKGLNVRVNYGYTFARFEDYQKSDTENFSGNCLPFVPKNTVGVLCDYILYVNKFVNSVTFAASYSGVGDIYWNDSNTIRESYYSLVNGRVSFETKYVTLDLWAKNITNQKYFAFQFESMGNNFVQLGRPLTFGGTVRVNL